jgi:signal transduction histidine kinase
MTNALKYSPADHPVTMGFTSDDERVRVWVRDTGPGLSQDAQQHIWRRFYQVPNTTVQTPVVGSRGVGLGLGLYICQNIIQRHGGQVGVESEQGHGATFWLTLPLYKPAPAEAG